MPAGKHTPGPWTYLDLGEVVCTDNFEVTIATLDHSQVDADGNLIAAAPEMFEALKKCREYLEGGNPLGVAGGHRNSYLRGEVAAAIAKAGGAS